MKIITHNLVWAHSNDLNSLEAVQVFFKFRGCQCWLGVRLGSGSDFPARFHSWVGFPFLKSWSLIWMGCIPWQYMKVIVPVHCRIQLVWPYYSNDVQDFLLFKWCSGLFMQPNFKFQPGSFQVLQDFLEVPSSGILTPWIRMIILVYTNISCVGRLTRIYLGHATLAWYHYLKWDIPYQVISHFRSWYHDFCVNILVYTSILFSWKYILVYIWILDKLRHRSFVLRHCRTFQTTTIS